jgi:hypothetical protein
VKKWEASQDIKTQLEDVTAKFDIHLKHTIGLNPALMMPGNYAREMFKQENMEHFLHLVLNDDKRKALCEIFALFRSLRKVYRAINPIYDIPDGVATYKAKAVIMAGLISTHFSYVPCTNYLHKVIEHVQELIEDPNGPGSIGSMSSEGNEGGNKVFRILRRGNARSCSTYDSLRDILWTHWLYTSPQSKPPNGALPRKYENLGPTQHRLEYLPNKKAICYIIFIIIKFSNMS